MYNFPVLDYLRRFEKHEKQSTFFGRLGGFNAVCGGIATNGK